MSLQKLKRIRTHDKFDTIDALLINKPENIMYLLGFNIESETSILIPSPNKEKSPPEITIYLNALEFDRAKAKLEQNKDLRNEVNLIKVPRNESEFVEKNINNFDITTLGFEDDFVTVETYNKWHNIFDEMQLEGCSEILMDARLIKTEQEIENMIKAAEFGIIGFDTIYKECKAGISEKELAAKAEFAMRKAGSEGTAFDTIVATGESSAYPHTYSSDKKVEKGDLVLVDIGARFNGYCSDMSRTFIFDGKQSGDFDKKARLVNLVNKGQQKALEEIKAGKRCSEIDKLVRDFFKNANKEWGGRFIHSLGHGVGLEIHERPYLSSESDNTLKTGMCVTVEPGLYIPGFGGARTEDLVMIKEDGYTSLTPAEKYDY